MAPLMWGGFPVIDEPCVRPRRNHFPAWIVDLRKEMELGVRYTALFG